MQKQFPMYDVHEVLEFVWCKLGAQVSAEEIQFYWDHFRRLEALWAVAHPATRDHCPVGIYGDEAVFTKGNDKFLGITLNMPLYRPGGNPFDSRWLLFIMRHCLFLGPQTLRPVWHRVAWSLNIAFTGRKPQHGPNMEPLSKRAQEVAGQEIAGGQKFALTEIRGDWKWHLEVFELSTWWSCNRICHQCPATRVPGRLIYSRFGRRGGWPIRTTGNFLLDCCPSQPVPLVCVTGFHMLLLKWCSMHVNNLGIVQRLLASVMLELVERGVWGAPGLGQDALLKLCYDDFRRWANASKIRHSQRVFTAKALHMTTRAGRPDYCYLNNKAYNGRVVLAFLSERALTAAAQIPLDKDLQVLAVCVSLVFVCVLIFGFGFGAVRHWSVHIGFWSWFLVLVFGLYTLACKVELGRLVPSAGVVCQVPESCASGRAENQERDTSVCVQLPGLESSGTQPTAIPSAAQAPCTNS